MPKFKFNPIELEKMEQNRWFTDRQREIFELYYRRGWSIEDVAAELYISRSTVDRDLKKIRKKSRYLIKEK